MDWMKPVAWLMFYTILYLSSFLYVFFSTVFIYLFSTDVITSNWFKSSVTVFKISDITKYFT